MALLPSEARYARSAATPHKQDGLRSTVQKHAGICKAIYSKYIWARPPYVFVDMNGGPGEDEDGDPGSPLVVASVLSAFAFDWRVLAFELDPATYAELAARCANRRGILAYNEDHNRMIDRLLNMVEPEKSFGMFYHDPSNAPGANFDLLRRAVRQFPRFEVLINLACASYKRTVDLPEYKSISDQLSAIGKQVWLIRRPSGKHQWSMFLGTNYGDYRKYGDFVRLDSAEGREIFEVLSTTKNERQLERQASLYGLSATGGQR